MQATPARADLPESLLKEVLAPLFPERKIARVEATRIRSFQHQLFHLRAHFSEGEEELFFRLYAGNFSWWELEADLRAKEEAAFAYLDELNLPTPDFLLQSDVPPISITRRVPGFPVAERLSVESIGALAQALAELHARSAAAFPRSRLFPDLQLPTLFARLRSWSEEGGDPKVRALVDWAEQGLAYAEERRCFLHGDCNAKNFLSTPEGIVMLDLEECGVGDPRIDLASMLTNLPRGGAFDARAEFLKAYEKASGRTIEPLDAWMNLIDVRDIVTARVVEQRQREGRLVPRFDAQLWGQYASELFPNVIRRVNAANRR